MDEISYIFTKSGTLSMQMTCKILYTKYWFYVMQICHKYIKIEYSRIYVQWIKGFTTECKDLKLEKWWEQPTVSTN